MRAKALMILTCMGLLCGCSRAIPDGETCQPVPETQTFTEAAEEPTVPEN